MITKMTVIFDQNDRYMAKVTIIWKHLISSFDE